MAHARSRFSRRHLLALCTFLIPLGVLAWLGQGELRRQGRDAQAALEREALQFVTSAALAIEQRLDQQLPPLLDESSKVLAEHPPIEAIRILREHSRYGALLDILLLDEHGRLVWPTAPPNDMGLPFAADARDRFQGDSILPEVLQATDLLVARGQYDAARRHLQDLVTTLEQAQPQEPAPGPVANAGNPGADGRPAPPGQRGARREPGFDDGEIAVRFRLANLQRKLGDTVQARVQLQRVRDLVQGRDQRFRDSETQTYDLLAEAALAELQPGPDDRLRLLRAIADGSKDRLAEGLVHAVAEWLRDGVAKDAPEREVVEQTFRDELVRNHARRFAADYNDFLVDGWRRRLQPGADLPLYQVATIRNTSSILAVRALSAAEKQRYGAELAALRLDLPTLLVGPLEAFVGEGSNFVLAINDPDGMPIVAAPANVPAEFTPPPSTSYGLQLRAFPADAEQFVAEERARTRISVALVLALFVAALGGALWLWRSVSREAELASLKVDLVSRVSHELKTPLSLIRMYGETIGMGRAKDLEQTRTFGGIIVRESERLTTLIHRILDFSRQQVGTLQYSQSDLDLGEVLQGVTEAYRPHLQQKGATLTTRLEPGLRASVDGPALESAVLNLLENAVKYAREEDPDRSVHVELARSGEQAAIEVSDRGRGVPDGERERVFDSFYRGSNAGEVRGAGLGLSLVRHFALAHGGGVEARPRAGGGTTFRILLPMLRSELRSPGGQSAPNDRKPEP